MWYRLLFALFCLPLGVKAQVQPSASGDSKRIYEVIQSVIDPYLGNKRPVYLSHEPLLLRTLLNRYSRRPEALNKLNPYIGPAALDSLLLADSIEHAGWKFQKKHLTGAALAVMSTENLLQEFSTTYLTSAFNDRILGYGLRIGQPDYYEASRVPTRKHEPGWILLCSVPVFIHSDLCLLYVSRTCGQTCGGASLGLWQRNGDCWERKEHIMGWMY